MKKILVTGGTGFLGSGLVRALLESGHEVRVLDNNSRGSLRRLASVVEDFEFIEADIRNDEAVSAATRGMEWVFHLAFVNGTRFFYERPQVVLDVGVRGALTTMDAAVEHGVERYIVASSSEVYQQPTKIPTDESERLIVPDVTNPRFSYGGGKLITELLALHYLGASEVQRVIFRPHNVYGPDMGNEHVVPEFIRRVKRLSGGPDRLVEFPLQGTGEETRAFCYVDDATAGIMLAAELGENGSIYNVGVSQETTIGELARKIGELAGLRLTLRPQDLPKGGTSRRCPEISRLSALGYRPAVSLDEGLRKSFEWYWENI